VNDLDPLATPTLARLYLGQGHFDRARAVLTACLQRDPKDGHALALLRRIDARSDASLAMTLNGDRLLLKWTGVARPSTRSVVVVAIAAMAGTAARWVTSMRCKDPFGRWECPLPFPRGSASACIGHVDSTGWAVDTVARPLSWP
jgi:tetratricopeptide repeat protein